MSFRVALLSSTLLSSLALLTAPMIAFAGDDPPSTRAVDGVNGKIEGLGGGYATKGLYGTLGSLSLPLGDQFGVQFDGAAGGFANRFIGMGGAHLFWRNPQQGLVGVYGDYTHWDQYGGVHSSHIGPEAEAYLGRWTLHGIAGVEFGNNSSVVTSNKTSSQTTVGIPGGGTLTTTTTTTTTTSQLADVTRFFDRVSLSYYLTDDWKASIGHRYFGGKHSLALGTEYAIAAGRGVMASLFGGGQLGEGSNNYGVWGGIRVYFGQHDKSLMRRHREDDPDSDLSTDTLFGIANSLGPNSSSSSTTTNATCPPGEVFVNGACVGGGG